MMPPLLRHSPNDARCLCWFSADNIDPRLATSDCSMISTKRRKISLCKTLAARSRSQSYPSYEVQADSPLPRSSSRTPEPAPKSP
jgi:hypothetical protein